MPQAKYYLVHWGASFNDAKKEVALSWVKHHRMGLYTDVAVAPDFINEPIRPIADSISVDVRKVVFRKSVVSRHPLYRQTTPFHVPAVMVWIPVALQQAVF